MIGVELTTSPSFHCACTVAPLSFTTLNVRSRRPVTCEPRTQLMMSVASFLAVVPAAPVLVQYSTLAPPR